MASRFLCGHAGAALLLSLSATVLLIGAVLLTAPFPAHAEPAVAKPAVAEPAVIVGVDASECEIAAALGLASANCPTHRGLTIGTSAVSLSVPQSQPKAAFKISFEIGSATLTTESEKLLDRIATVFAAPEAGNSRFLIAGHTDSTGNAERNLKLSEKRATAVANHLISRHKIAAIRLQAIGLGSKEPIHPQNPTAAENRRVEITNLGE
ncbi:OmpA family protein [Azospirillaceae bacterium]